MKNNKKTVNRSWIQLILGALFLAMSVGQILNFAAFVEILATYQFFTSDALSFFAAIIILTELYAGLGLVFTKLPFPYRKAAGVFGVLVALFWTILGAQAFVRGLDISNCGCFGAYLAQPLRWWILVEDIFFVAGAIRALQQIKILKQ
jgi:hypothetical protein